MIFLDGGCYNGDSIENALRWEALLPFRFDKIYGFDPNPQFKSNWANISNRDERITFEQKAVWVKDEDVKFTLREGHKALGGTIMEDKDHFNDGYLIGVPAFDLSKFLKQFDDKSVILKLDVEGAEYPILEKLIKDGTQSKLNFLFVEWHNQKMAFKYTESQKFIEENLTCGWKAD